MQPIFFEHPSEFREWLEEHHQSATEVLVGYFKVGTAKPSMTWSQSVDQALCFGWIDGVRKSIDKESYCIRFTPRKPSSIWSAVNIKKIEELTQQGLMHEAGLAIYNKRNESNTNVYSFEKQNVAFSSELEALFKLNTKAWKYFQSLAPSYQKASVNWVMSAKQQATQTKRLNMLIAESEAETNQWKDNKYSKKRKQIKS